MHYGDHRQESSKVILPQLINHEGKGYDLRSPSQKTITPPFSIQTSPKVDAIATKMAIKAGLIKCIPIHTNALWFLGCSWAQKTLHIKEGIMIITSRNRSKAAFALCSLSLSLLFISLSDTSVNRTFEVAASTNRITIGCCNTILSRNATDLHCYKQASVVFQGVILLEHPVQSSLWLV